jgi:hypothetical protein
MRWLVAVLAAVIAVQVGVGLAVVQGLAGSPGGVSGAVAEAGAPAPPYAATRPDTLDYSGGLGADPAAAAVRQTAVRTLLDRRAHALLGGDRTSFLGTVDPEAPAAFRTRQAHLVDNLARVPLALWTYQLDPTVEQPVTAAGFARYHAPVWAPRVTVCYALRGFDSTCTERPQSLTFVRRAHRWYLGADDDFAASGGRTWRGLWDFGPVSVYHGRYSLLLAHPDNAGRLAALARLVDQAVPAVTAAWGTDWTRRVVVVIPASQREMAEVIGDAGSLTDIAAVATADYADPLTGVVRGQRVVVNPANLARLGYTGQVVVIRHEVTHLASRAVTGPDLPTWLVEGLADYVGYLGTGVPVSVASQELRTEVQRGDYPTALPADGDFGFGSARLPQSYEEAWLACRLIAKLAGRTGLVRLYRQVGTARVGQVGNARVGQRDTGRVGRGQALDQAMRRVLSMSYQQFVQRWQATVVTELS